MFQPFFVDFNLPVAVTRGDEVAVPVVVYNYLNSAQTVELTFDASQYTGTGVFLFASVLEAFLGLYCSLNSFNQLVARIQQREGVLKQWPPRAGETQLL